MIVNVNVWMCSAIIILLLEKLQLSYLDDQQHHG